MAKIKNMINGITGADEEAYKKREQFIFLQKMAQTKCAEFKADLENKILEDKNKIEIGEGGFVQYYSAQYADIHLCANEFIDEAVDSFFRGPECLKDDFKKLISGALEDLINDTTIGEKQEDMFFIYPEYYAVIKLDVKVYKYNLSGNEMVADCENVFCYTVAESIIDPAKLKLNELLYLVSDMSGAEKNIEVVKSFIHEISSIWAKLEK